MLNVCTDRYRFTVGLAACLMSERVSLLPSTHTPQVIAQLAAFAPDAFCLTDDPALRHRAAARLLSRICCARSTDLAVSPSTCRASPRAQLAAIVFTSGSTGTPLPYKKDLGPAGALRARRRPAPGLVGRPIHALIGTVPAQHMYGFESTVLLALLSGNAFSAERPFYPADIAAAVRRVPRPRVLVTTPIHLRTLLASEVDFPPVDLVVSATAPLSQELAREVEEQYQAPLAGDLRLDRDRADRHAAHGRDARPGGFGRACV